MTDNTDNKLHKVFDIEVIPEVENIPVLASSSSTGNTREADLKFVRNNLVELVENGKKAMEGILDLAQQSDSPRAYEVAAQIINSLADVNTKIVELHKKTKEEVEKEKSEQPNINNAIFVGSTKELQDILKGKLPANNT